MSLFTYAYLLRVPLLVTAILIAFTFLGTHKKSPVYGLLHGIFDVGERGLMLVSGQLMLLVVALSVVSNLVIWNGPVRFGLPDNPWAKEVSWGLAALYTASGILVLWRIVRFVLMPTQLKVTAVAIGLAVASVLSMLSYALWGKPDRYLTAILFALERYIGPGYVTTSGEMAPAHASAAVTMSVFLLIYLLFAFRVFPLAPTLTSLLNLITLLTFLFAGMGFLLDYWRLPFLIVLGLILFASSWVTKADDFFPSTASRDPELIPPRRVLEMSKTDTAIIVCAEGGGIQSAAWTGQVLASLDQETEGELSRQLRLLSSVSGGSLGSAYFLSQYANGQVRNHDQILAASVSSSLDEAAFGLVYRDFIRVFLPWVVPKLNDRGTMMEMAWANQKAAEPIRGKLIADWRAEVAAGLRPANIFNAMIAETGQRFLMSTVDMGSNRGRRELSELYSRFDLHPMTAARLSATFPFVSPTPRIDADVAERFHFVDGGYYDNFGVATAVDFLLDATTDGSPVERILWIDIVGLTLGTADNPDPARAPAHGWAYQAIAPLQALVQMRTTSQVSRDQVDVAMLQEILGHRGVKEFHRVKFFFPTDDAPLSWHLTKEEIKAVRDAWMGTTVQVKEVKEFLKGSHAR